MNIRGGIEFSFMSVTTSREVAMTYAGNSGSTTALIFEMQMGMIVRK